MSFPSVEETLTTERVDDIKSQTLSQSIPTVQSTPVSITSRVDQIH